MLKKKLSQVLKSFWENHQGLFYKLFFYLTPIDFSLLDLPHLIFFLLMKL
jgi:hypothetical protein